MDWIRQNTFLATFGAISLIGFLGLGFFAFSSWKGSSAAIAEFETTRSNLEGLENAKLHPNTENLKRVKTEVDAYAKSVDDLMKKLEAGQKPLPTDVDVTKFGEKIQVELLPFQEKAQKLNVVMGDNFYMGMDKYRTETARNTEVLQKLEWSLGGISHLADIALDSGIDSINSFQRFIEPWELAEAKAAEPEPKSSRGSNRSSSRSSRDKPKKAAGNSVKAADVREETRVQMTITGSPDSITEFFNKVSNDSEYFYWIRWAKIGNETPSGPSRDKIFTPERVGEGGERREEDEDEDAPREAAEEIRPAMKDVFPILGTEKVRAKLLVDIVRFREPVAPEADKTGSKKQDEE